MIKKIVGFVFACCVPFVSFGFFPDIVDHEYAGSIVYLQEAGVVQGYPDGSFGPDRSLSRAEITKIIVLGSMNDTGALIQTSCFPDVQSGAWFAPYVCYAKENGIVKGYPDGSFQPEKKVTIAEGLKIGLETFDQPVDEVNQKHRYQPYLEFVHKNDIFSQYGLSPNSEMSRGQMAYLTHQLMLESKDEIRFAGVRNSRSLGCGQPAPNPVPSSSLVGGLERSYITAVGKNYDSNVPTKLVFAFHGRTNPNTMVRQYYKLEKVWDENAIIVYPSGLPEEGPQRNRGNQGDLRDVALFDQLVKEFSESYCIDMDQIFVVGHSLGAWFANTLSCVRGDVIRAVGSVGGGTTVIECSGPSAAIIMHHPDDRLSDFRSGLTNRDQLLAQNICGQETMSVGPDGGNCVQYLGCQEGADVVWCPHSDDDERGRYYPHTWPDFAAEAIWEFFDRQD